MDKTIRNGFPLVTREDIEGFSIMAMDAAESLRTILAGIRRLSADDPEIAALAAMGKSIADGLHNDIDVIREQAEKAGLLGELVEEARHG